MGCLWSMIKFAMDSNTCTLHQTLYWLCEIESNSFFFHAFTGCDVVSAFRGKGNGLHGKRGMCTLRLHNYLQSSVCTTSLERFAIITGLVQLLILTVSDWTCLPTGRRSHTINAALDYHIKRASYQASCIWGQTTIRQMEILSPSERGWKQQNNSWQIIWTSLPPFAESCKQLTKCGCMTACRGRCKCYRFRLPLTELYSCSCERL